MPDARTRKLTPEEVMSFQTQAEEGWQEQLKEIARGKIHGFQAEILPEEIPGYGVLPEREFRIKLLDRAHALFNAVRHRLDAATRAADPEAEWSTYVKAQRTHAIVRVLRVYENGAPKELPKAFCDELLRMQVRTSRGLKPGVRAQNDRRVVGTLGTGAEKAPDGRESREEAMAG